MSGPKGGRGGGSIKEVVKLRGNSNCADCGSSDGKPRLVKSGVGFTLTFEQKYCGRPFLLESSYVSSVLVSIVPLVWTLHKYDQSLWINGNRKQSR